MVRTTMFLGIAFTEALALFGFVFDVRDRICTRQPRVSQNAHPGGLAPASPKRHHLTPGPSRTCGIRDPTLVPTGGGLLVMVRA